MRDSKIRSSGLQGLWDEHFLQPSEESKGGWDDARRNENPFWFFFYSFTQSTSHCEKEVTRMWLIHSSCPDDKQVDGMNEKVKTLARSQMRANNTWRVARTFFPRRFLFFMSLFVFSAGYFSYCNFCLLLDSNSFQDHPPPLFPRHHNHHSLHHLLLCVY
jgi:hypothetical protein